MKQKIYAEKLHAWNVDFREASRLQKEFASRLIIEDRLGPIKHVVGVDVSYAVDSDRLVAGAVVLDAETLEVLEKASLVGATDIPYLPGFLSFREIPPLLEVLSQLSLKPDLIVCDGQGIAHPRRMGVAAHLGLWVQIPTLGCAKSPLIYSPLPGPKRGDRAAVMDKGELVGYALRTRDKVKPVYVSPGHLISLETACDWVLKLAPKWRLPETTRQADHMVGELMRAANQADRAKGSAGLDMCAAEAPEGDEQVNDSES